MNITLFIKEKLNLLSMINSPTACQGATRKGQFKIVGALRGQERREGGLLIQLIYFVGAISDMKLSPIL